ncbi:MAG TPA: hypothetical protein VH855_09375 [Acetobacteraceae bacterium]|jgi:hypothetical protein
MQKTKPEHSAFAARPIAPGAELAHVRDQLRRIARLVSAGMHPEAREASAALMFEFQPIILACPQYAARFADLLRRCGAAGLSRRFQLAAGDDPELSILNRSGQRPGGALAAPGGRPTARVPVAEAAAN